MTYDQALVATGALRDGLGMPVDGMIRKPVAALMARGFTTHASCAGHLDHGEPYPWIDIGSGFDLPVVTERCPDNIHDLADAMQALTGKLQIQGIYATVDTTSDGDRYFISATPGSKNCKPARDNPEQKRLRRQNGRERLRLVELLAMFYTSRQTRYDRTLVTVSGGTNGDFRLQSSGAELADLVSESERSKFRQAYRTELDDFADFLIEHGNPDAL